MQFDSRQSKAPFCIGSIAGENEAIAKANQRRPAVISPLRNSTGPLRCATPYNIKADNVTGPDCSIFPAVQKPVQPLMSGIEMLITRNASRTLTLKGDSNSPTSRIASWSQITRRGRP
jgi:hypothetical protein